MTEQSGPAEQVIKIDPKGKYLIVFPMRLTDEEVRGFRETIDQWWEDKDASPFLMIDGGVRVIKLEKYGEEKSRKRKPKAKKATKKKT